MILLNWEDDTFWQVISFYCRVEKDKNLLNESGSNRRIRAKAQLYFASLLFYVLAWNLPKYSPEGPFLWSEVKGEVLFELFIKKITENQPKILICPSAKRIDDVVQ